MELIESAAHARAHGGHVLVALPAQVKPDFLRAVRALEAGAADGVEAAQVAPNLGRGREPDRKSRTRTSLGT